MGPTEEPVCSLLRYAHALWQWGTMMLSMKWEFRYKFQSIITPTRCAFHGLFSLAGSFLEKEVDESADIREKVQSSWGWMISALWDLIRYKPQDWNPQSETQPALTENGFPTCHPLPHTAATTISSSLGTITYVPLCPKSWHSVISEQALYDTQAYPLFTVLGWGRDINPGEERFW